jgi:hypothetical protein
MFNVLIFSKDRSCQLELLLRSIKTYFNGWERYTFNILFKYSSESFKQGYDKLKIEHPEFNYIQETNFKADVIRILSKDRPYTMFGVDDDVFKEPFDPGCNEVKLLSSEDKLVCLSLRMHPRIAYCYTENVETPAPSFVQINPYIWEWWGLPGDWGYTQSIDFSVFRTEEILPKCHSLPYQNPNTFEGVLSAQPIHRPWMTCFEKSKIVNIPANKVQTVNGNRCGNTSAELLNTMYLTGYKIDLTNIMGFKNISAHQDISLKLRQG